MQATREKILAYLASYPNATAGELARSLDLTAANIRYHMGLLLASRQVHVAGKRKTGGAGRPFLVYNLTPLVLGTNTTKLLEVFLEAIEDHPENISILHRIAELLTKTAQIDAKNQIQRFNQAVEFLNQLHYHAAWEVSPDGPQITLRHCPYANLAESHHQLCLIDTEFISILFGTDLKLIRKRSFGKDTFSPCIFSPLA
jgi:predicted ArsR family transcriptional regulator